MTEDPTEEEDGVAEGAGARFVQRPRAEACVISTTGVGAIPVHRQRVGWAPSRAALEGGQAEQRHMVSEDGVAQLVRSSNSPVVLDLRDVPADVLSSYASELGPPDELTATGALWRWP